MAEGRVPGEARPVRHHGRHTSRRDRLPRAGESGPGWTATVAGANASATHAVGVQEARSTWSAMRMTSSSRAHRGSSCNDEVQPLVEHFLTRAGSRTLPREDQDHAYRGRLRFPGPDGAALSQWQGLDQAIEAERQDVPGQDPGDDRRLGQHDGGRLDPALESTDQGLDDVPPLCRE